MIVIKQTVYNNTVFAHNFIKICFLLFVIFTSICSAFALDDVGLVDRIDLAFQRQSNAELDGILTENTGFDNYAKIEVYVLKKIRESLIFDRLEYAHFASLALVDHNLDNFDALDLYARINETLNNRQTVQTEIEEVRLGQLVTEQKIAEDIRGELRTDFRQVVTAEGQNIYFATPTEIRYSPFDWSVSIGFVEFAVISTPSVTSAKYGMGASVDMYYYGDVFAIGGQAAVASYIVAFFGAENFVTDFKIVPAISFLDLSNNLFFRVGFIGMFSDPTQDGTIVSQFLSPIVGFEWKKIPIGITQSSVYVDYLFGHVAVPEVNTAIDMGIKTVIPISDQGRVSIGVLIGFFDTLMITDSGVENHARLTISLGVGNYE